MTLSRTDVTNAAVAMIEVVPMVEAINHVGGALGLKTVAEFVETEATLQRLRDIGVDYAQGFVIHRPEPLFAGDMA